MYRSDREIDATDMANASRNPRATSHFETREPSSLSGFGQKLLRKLEMWPGL